MFDGIGRPWRRDGGALPNLIVIGAMKCGTTSLHHYLGYHPEISMSRPKELKFFVAEKNWSRGLSWYRSHFPPGTKVRGETSPDYSHATRFPGVPARMHAVVPEARLIYIVRDPIERMISHWIQLVSKAREDRSVEEALTDSAGDNEFVRRSRYHLQLRRFLEYYDRSQILVLSAEHLRDRRRRTLRRAYRFLGVDPDFSSIRFQLKRHMSGRKRRLTKVGRWLEATPAIRALRQIPIRYRWPVEDLIFYPFSRRIPRPRLGEDVRAELRAWLRQDVEEFRKLTGREFAEWSV